MSEVPCELCGDPYAPCFVIVPDDLQAPDGTLHPTTRTIMACARCRKLDLVTVLQLLEQKGAAAGNDRNPATAHPNKGITRPNGCEV